MKKFAGKIFAGIIFLLFATICAAQLYSYCRSSRSAAVKRDLSAPLAQITLETELPEPGVMLLVNGAERESFSNKIVTASVTEYSLIEVSCEEVNHPVTVAVTGIPDYVNRSCLTQKASGFQKKILIGRILFQ